MDFAEHDIGSSFIIQKKIDPVYRAKKSIGLQNHQESFQGFLTLKAVHYLIESQPISFDELPKMLLINALFSN